MKAPWADKPAAALGLATMVLALCLGHHSGAHAQSVPFMTIKIFNNSDTHNIYPVLTTGTSATGLWLQAWFKVPKSQMGDKPFPKPKAFRFYVNPTGAGIPPGKSVVIQLPLLTQLVPTNRVDPKKGGQYIDWWGGGRVEIFDAPVATGRPPAALTALFRNRPSQTRVAPIAGTPLPACPACQPFTFFTDTDGFKNNEPAQLTEYTLGAINQNKDPVELNPKNVDFDVSYVDTAYLPAAMAPFNTELPVIAQVGYVGTPQPIQKFRDALTKFLAASSPYTGWPQFIDNQGRKILKVPSLVNLFALDPNQPLPPDYTPKPWPPVDRLAVNWKSCIPPTNQKTICQDMRAVRDLFLANYAKYRAIFPQKCDRRRQPVPLTEDLMISHVYGFTPFSEFCPDSDVNLLADTPGYSANGSKRFHEVKNVFDGLQYWQTGEFAPYTVLIHGEDYVNAPNVYAYSVDDAVGNLQADGTGFIIAVGGTRGLPNPRPAAPPINVNFGAPSVQGSFTHYGVCTTNPRAPVNPDHRSIALNIANKDIARCPLSLRTDKGAIFKFKIKSGPPYAFDPKALSPKTHAPIDCSGITPGTPQKIWCDQIFAYSEYPPGKGPLISNVITPGL